MLPTIRQPILRWVDWIWWVRGSIAVPPGLSRDAAIARVAPILDEYGTSIDRSGDALAFTKKDQAAQDRLATFDRGTLRIEPAGAGLRLRYDLMSRSLLFCFLAPLLFLALAQATIAVVRYEKPAAEKPESARKPPLPMNPIDKALGAPAPDKPKKDKKGEKDKKLTPKAAYIFAGIFATLYLVGRVLEHWLARSRLRRLLADD